MAKIADKITFASKRHLVLYKEGIFWMAYEQSAYFVAQRKGYTPVKKFYKNIEREIVSVGFTRIDEFLSELSSAGNSISIDKQLPNCIEIVLDKDIDTHDFELWKANLQQKGKQQDTKSDIENMIKSFPLAHRTPMEAFFFIKRLQEITEEKDSK